MKALKSYLKKSFLFNVKVTDPASFRENAILIFADPRSGSTWLAELLNTMPGSKIIDEPLNLKKTPFLSEEEFGWRQVIPADATWDLPFNYLSNLFNGKTIPKSLVDHKVGHKVNIEVPIYKFIRGKMLANWLLTNFSFMHKPVFLVRHPMAMISSLKQHPNWSYPFKKFEIPDQPFNDLYKTHYTFLSSLETVAEQLLAFWCLSNQETRNMSKLKENFQVVYYENLMIKPEEELRILFKNWNIEFKKSYIAESSKPSSSSLSKQNLASSHQQLSKWRTQLEEDEIIRYQAILDYFKIDIYNRESIMPII